MGQSSHAPKAMEARSLTDLNYLANNPPQYFEGTKTLESLVLYISRVPQTKNVILSTMKPKKRNVTDVDVNSALYMVELLSDPEPARDETAYRSSEDSGLSPMIIPRKPLPDSARPLTPDSLSGRGRMHQPSATSDAATPRVSGPTEAPGRTALGLHTGMPTRKPLGPRPLLGLSTETSTSTELIVPGNCSRSQEDAGLAQSSHVNPISVPPLDTYVPPTSIGSQTYPSRSQLIPQTDSRSPSPQKRSAASTGTPFVLRLIRRDPSTGISWVVGHIRSQLESLPEEADRASTSTTAPVQHHPVDIEIIASGYAKLRSRHVKKHSLTESGGLEATAGSMARGSLDCQRSMGRNNEVFYRQVAMGYSDSSKTTIKKAFQGAMQYSEQVINRHRSDSAASVASNKSNTFVVPDYIVTSGPQPEGMKARGYTFLSPWGGQCVFTTGVRGASLECHHTPSLPPTGHSNSLVESRHSNSDNARVSELRYNLALSPDQAKGSGRTKGNFSNLFKMGSSGSSSESDICDEPSYTNVGAERAGGGSDGRAAKLGKLIISDGGFKMLDLLVAANIGVWWKTWEKYSPVNP